MQLREYMELHGGTYWMVEGDQLSDEPVEATDLPDEILDLSVVAMAPGLEQHWQGDAFWWWIYKSPSMSNWREHFMTHRADTERQLELAPWMAQQMEER